MTCGHEVFLRGAGPRRRAHFAHHAGESCEGSYNPERTRAANASASEEANEGQPRPCWLRTLTEFACHAGRCFVPAGTQTLVLDVLGADGVPIFVQCGPITTSEIRARARELAALGRPRPVWLVRHFDLRLFEDVAYDGSPLRSAGLELFPRLDSALGARAIFVDADVRGCLLRIDPLTDGHIYRGRMGTCHEVSAEQALQELYGDALRRPAAELAEMLGRHQSGKGGPPPALEWGLALAALER
jgi:hypothetical protein